MVLELYQGGWTGGTAAYLTTLLPALPPPFVPVYMAPAGDPGLERLAAVGVAVEVVDPPALAGAARRLGTALVHSHGVRAGRTGASVSRQLHVPRAHTVHSRLAQDYHSTARRMAAAWADASNLRHADALIAVSPAVAEDVVLRGAPARRVHIVESGVTPPPGAADRADLCRALDLDLPADAAVIGTLARHHPVKGLDVLLRALPEVPGAHAVLMGTGSQTAGLQALAARLSMDGRVHWAGYRPDGRALLSALDIAVVPSRAEGFGLAAVEAMAAGVPVVASAVGHLPELLASGAGVLVPAEDPGALAAALRRLLADRSAREELAAKGHARYLERYTQEAMASRTAAVWRGLLGMTPD